MSTVRLLDVNVLVALLDSGHVHHANVKRHFLETARDGWATCPLTENGFVRILSSPAYPNLRLRPAQAARMLGTLQTAFAASHFFWADGVSLLDQTIFDLEKLTGAKQTSDAYLAGLAASRGGRLATLDGGVPWRAIRGASEQLVERWDPPVSGR